MLFKYILLKYAYQEEHICGAEFTKHDASLTQFLMMVLGARTGSDWVIHTYSNVWKTLGC